MLYCCNVIVRAAQISLTVYFYKLVSHEPIHKVKIMRIITILFVLFCFTPVRPYVHFRFFFPVFFCVIILPVLMPIANCIHFGTRVFLLEILLFNPNFI